MSRRVGDYGVGALSMVSGARGDVRPRGGEMWAEGVRGEVLECHVGKAVVGVPRVSVKEIVEVQLSPLPLPARFIGGVAVVQGRVTVGVLLTQPNQKPRLVKGVVLNADDSEVGWLLEVSSVAGFSPITVGGARERVPTDRMPHWVQRGRTIDGRALVWLDVPTMLRELTQGMQS